MIEKGVSHIAYFRLDGGSSKLYTQEYVDEKDEEIKRLKEEYMILQNASDEVEEEKDKEIERLNNIIEKAIKGIEDYYYGDKEYKEYDYTLAYQIYHILKGSDKE